MEEPNKKKQEKIVQRVIEKEMKTSYLDYAMSVIVGRALPDARDGLKPVHRRVLYAMHHTGLFHNKPYRKSAFVVGRVLAEFHPHGDQAVYDALVRMAQDFSLRYPLISGQGNFGSVDGDSAAAMRYTEARLSKIAEEMLFDIDKETVKFVPNFDNSSLEPTVLPSKLPNLLINGSSGIAVGMATNIPPHNICEIIDGVVKFIENPEISIRELMGSIKGPDFPTGGIIYGKSGILHAYEKGRGRLIVRAKTITDDTKNKERIIVTEIPYMVNKSQLIQDIASFVKEKKIRGISDIRDESDREGMRIVFEIKAGMNPQIVLNQLFKHTRMQLTFGVIMIALVNNEPKVLNLKELIFYYVKHRQDVVRKRTEFNLKKSEEKAHLLQGLIIALKDIDATIKIIKQSTSIENAKQALISNFKLSALQAHAILDMKLQRLTSLEQESIKKEYEGLLKLIEELKSILASEQKIMGIIKKELIELKEKYHDGRRTQITDFNNEIQEEDMVQEVENVVTVTHQGYIKRLPLKEYKQQHRGGKGVVAAGTKGEDFVEDLFIANSRNYMLIFTNKGKIKWLKVYTIPEASRQAKGKAIINLLDLEKDEKVTACVPVRDFDDKHFLVMSTKKGIVKKTNLISYSKPRKSGIIAITLDENDELINVILTDGNKQIMLATKKGNAVRFDENEIRPVGRSARGVIGIRLKENDEVIGMVECVPDQTLLTVTENGYGKRTQISEYRLISRGGSGVINIQCSERNGNVVSIKSVSDKDELMFISQKGIIIRTKAAEVSIIGRNTQGVRVMKLEESDKLVAAAIVKENSS